MAAQASEADTGQPAETTIGDVLAEDAAQRAEARAAGPADPIAEAGALAMLFEDEGACAVCSAKLGGRWAAPCLEQWQRWKDAPRAQLGSEVARVVESLDATHLLPTGIRERLLGGHDAACFGLATLLTHMQPPPPVE